MNKYKSIRRALICVLSPLEPFLPKQSTREDIIVLVSILVIIM